MMKRAIGLAIIAFIVIASQLASAGPKSDKPEVFSTRAGAIRGYDPVAYFTQQAPAKGDRTLSHRWKGADWYFSSEDNRQLFVDNPDKYAPQYGGWCAYAMSRGSYAKIDPQAWTIVDDKLFLNFSKSVRKKWLKDVPGNIARADDHWAKFSG